MRIDYEKLDTISITDLAKRLGIKQSNSGNWHCPNVAGHTNGDQTASMSIYEQSGSFTCHGCGAGGLRLDLVKLTLGLELIEAWQWIAREYGFKAGESDTFKKDINLPCRFIKSAAELGEKGSRFSYFMESVLKPRNATERDLYEIEKHIRKRYTLTALNACEVRISDVYNCLVFQPRQFSYNMPCTHSSNDYFIVEGMTDFVTAITMGLHDDFNIIARRNKSISYDIPNTAENVIYLLDPDDFLLGCGEDKSKQGAMNRCKNGFPKNCTVKSFKFTDKIEGVDLNGFKAKDLSEFWYNGHLKPTLLQIIKTVPIVAAAEYNSLTNKETEFVFWNNQMQIDGYDLFKIIEKDGFGFLRNYEERDDEYKLGRIHNNLVTWHSEDDVNQHVLHDIVMRLPETISPKITRETIRKAVYRANLFEKKKFNILPKREFSLNYDDKENYYMYLDESYIHVNKDTIEQLDYSNLKKPIFERSIFRNTKFDIVSPEQYEGCVWDTFLMHTCTPRKGGELDVFRYEALKSTIGYLLLKYQSPVLSKAVIFSENNLTDDPRGRTGKGLIAQMIALFNQSITINGKAFDAAGQFAFQDVKPYHTNIFLDDVLASFKFELMFSMLTDGFKVEAKHKGRQSISPQRSPKIMISTNKSIVPSDSPSFKARVHDMELYCYYNNELTPATEAGHWFFVDWDQTENNKFRSFVFSCVQDFLRYGLTKYTSDSLKIKQITKLCGLAGYEYLHDEVGKRLAHETETYFTKENLLTELKNATDIDKLSPKRVTQVITEYAKTYGLDVVTRCKHDGQNAYKLSKKGSVPKQENDNKLF